MNAVQWVENKPVGKRRRKVQWLGAPAFGVGALDVGSNAQAKALLAAWNSTDGLNWIDQYGTMPSDQNPNQWFDRDGQVLAGFTKWWNNSFPTKLPQPGTKGGIAWQDLTNEHLNALQQWAVQKGVPIPGSQPTPVPMDLSSCLAQCQNTYGLDPIQLATCAAACANKYPISPPVQPPPVQPPVTQPPVTPPPTQPPPAPAPPGTATTETKTNVWPWVLGGAAVLAVGALVLAGGR